MKIKQLVYEDFINYCRPSMFIGFSTCTWKCEKEAHCPGMCQNTMLAKQPNVDISNQELISRYINNPITKAVVLGGLEPIDSFDELLQFIKEFREQSMDTIVIYTGYNESEIQDKVNQLKQFKNIIIKFGRYIPNQEKHYDEVLGVYLASNNQYAKII